MRHHRITVIAYNSLEMVRMKQNILHIYLIVFAATTVVGTFLLIPWVLTVFSNTSYRFLMLFLMIILVSNLLAKIAYYYIEL